MEQTLGKRIAENRKRLGLTQDSLAEKLGITAQAVSKWENDQSCPDITVLPKLAEIFGISTDELLGREAPKQTAEVVEEEYGPFLNIDQNENGKWEFHWDSSKRGAIAFAMLLLVTGCIKVVTQLMQMDVSFWSILWPTAMMVFGVEGLFGGFSCFKLGLIAFGSYFLVNNLGIWHFDLAGELVFPIIVVLIGVSLLIDALKKPNKPRFTVTHNGKNVTHGDGESRCECSTDGDSFVCNLAFGENTHLVEVPVLSGGTASVSFGELRIDLTGCETVKEDCCINAECSFGELVLLVPRRFRVEKSTSTAFGAVDFVGYPDTEPAGTIYLNAKASFGEVQVQYL